MKENYKKILADNFQTTMKFSQFLIHNHIFMMFILVRSSSSSHQIKTLNVYDYLSFLLSPPQKKKKQT